MSTHNICFHGEIRKILKLLIEKSTFSGVMIDKFFLILLPHVEKFY